MAVEREMARRQYIKGYVAPRAHVPFGKLQQLSGLHRFANQCSQLTIAFLQCRFHGIGQPRANAIGNDETVDNGLNRMQFPRTESRHTVNVMNLAIDPYPHEAPFAHGRNELLKRATLPPHQGCGQHNPRARRILQKCFHDLLCTLPRHGLTALGTMLLAHIRKQQAQIVVNLGRRGHGGARIRPGCALLNGNSRRQPINPVHIRLVHLVQKLPGIRRQTFNIAPLPLGKKRIKGKRGLPGSAESGYNGQLSPGNIDRHVSEIVLPCALNGDVATAHDPSL